MVSKSILSLAGSISLFALACGSAPAREAQGHTNSAETAVDPQFTSGCATDDDCVAIAQAGCCDNGWLAAVKLEQIDAYYAANACTDQNFMCPQYVANDTRVAECNTSTKACELVAIADIKCKGFIANAHQCPSGYQCQLNPQFGGDIPGSCVTQTSSGSGDSSGDDAGAPTSN